MNLQLQTALVTGGAQGIGKAIAQRFLAEGLRVAIVDKDSEAGHETEKELSVFGDVFYIKTDVSQETAVRGCIQKTVHRYKHLDVLVNNAGLTDPETGFDSRVWHQVIGANLTGAFLCAKHAVPHLRKTRGRIVNIASTRALMSEPDTQAYSASKGGLVALTHSLAISLGPDIRVNCISPGWIDVSAWKKKSQRRLARLRPMDHAQHPVGRVGQPEDIASLALFLISAESEFITGQNYIVDGGMTRKMIYAG